MRLFMLLLAALCQYSVIAQTVSEADSLRVAELFHEAKQAYDLGKPEQVIATVRKANQLPKTPVQASAVFDYLGTGFLMLGNMDSAMYYYRISAAKDSVAGRIRGFLKTQSNIGNVHMMRGEFDKALKLWLVVLKDAEQRNDTDAIASVLSDVALIYDYQGNYALARQYAQRALDLYQQLHNTTRIADLQNQLATLAYFEGKLTEAIELWESTLALTRTDSNTNLVPTLLSNLSKAHQQQGELELALTYAREAFELDMASEFSIAIGQSHNRMASILSAMNRHKEAKEHASKSLELAQQSERIGDIQLSAQTLVEIETALGNYKAALEMQQLATQMADSLTSAENIHALAELQASFKYEQQALQDSIEAAERDKLAQAQLAAEQAKSEAKSQQLWFLIAMLALAAAGVLFALNRNRIAQRQNRIIARQKAEVEHANRELDTRNQEKEVLLKEIHHRVKNNLQIISSLLELQSRGIDDETALSAVADGQSRVKSMALIHQKLYQTEDIAKVHFGHYANDLCNQLAALYQHSNTSAVHIQANNIELDIDTAIPIGLILNELITNAYKYALGNGATELHIALAQQHPGTYLLTVRDNGPGLPATFNFATSRSLGLRLVRRLSKQLYGKATYKNEEGAIFEVQFKNTEARKETE